MKDVEGVVHNALAERHYFPENTEPRVDYPFLYQGYNLNTFITMNCVHLQVEEVRSTSTEVASKFT
jgi:hypothetical protein